MMNTNNFTDDDNANGIRCGNKSVLVQPMRLKEVDSIDTEITLTSFDAHSNDNAVDMCVDEYILDASDNTTTTETSSEAKLFNNDGSFVACNGPEPMIICRDGFSGCNDFNNHDFCTVDMNCQTKNHGKELRTLESAHLPSNDKFDRSSNIHAAPASEGPASPPHTSEKATPSVAMKVWKDDEHCVNSNNESIPDAKASENRTPKYDNHFLNTHNDNIPDAKAMNPANPNLCFAVTGLKDDEYSLHNYNDNISDVMKQQESAFNFYKRIATTLKPVCDMEIGKGSSNNLRRSNRSEKTDECGKSLTESNNEDFLCGNVINDTILQKEQSNALSVENTCGMTVPVSSQKLEQKICIDGDRSSDCCKHDFGFCQRLTYHQIGDTKKEPNTNNSESSVKLASSKNYDFSSLDEAVEREKSILLQGAWCKKLEIHSLTSTDNELTPKPRCSTTYASGTKKIVERTWSCAVPHSPSSVSSSSSIEVCIVLDTSDMMKKFRIPLLTNLKRFWTLVTGASNQQHLRMAMVTTSSRKLNFTSNVEEFESFTESVFDEAIENEEEDRYGLERATTCMNNKIKWTKKSAQFIYVLANLSNWNGGADESDIVKDTMVDDLSRVARAFPKHGKVFVGCWLSDNDFLCEAFAKEFVMFKRFPLLDVKAMVLCIDNDLVGRLRLHDSAPHIMTKVKVILKPTEPLPCLFNTTRCQNRIFRGHIMVASKIDSMQGIHSINESQWMTEDCWLQIDANWVHSPTLGAFPSRNRLYCLGKIGYKRRECENPVVLKSFKLDVMQKVNSTGDRRTVQMNLSKMEQCYKNQLFVSEIAKLLQQKYNDEHRHNHCRKIHFLSGSVVCISRKKLQQTFYAEERIDCESYTVFCDDTGKWNKKWLDESLLRFTQTCFKLTGGEVMLSGLKGVLTNEAYYLTTPTLLSRTYCNGYTSECTKEYMKKFRLETKELMAEKSWKNKIIPKNNLWHF